eukprot:4275537-Prymnesium_polylepis.1
MVCRSDHSVNQSVAAQVECIEHALQLPPKGFTTRRNFSEILDAASERLSCCSDGGLADRASAVVSRLGASFCARSARRSLPPDDDAFRLHVGFLSTLPPVPCREDLGDFAQRYFYRTDGSGGGNRRVPGRVRYVL